MTLDHRLSADGAPNVRGVAGGHAYERVFDGGPTAWVVAAIEGLILDANAAAQRLLGGTRAQLAGRRLDGILDVDLDEAVRRLAGAEPGEAVAFTGTGRRLDGVAFTVGVEVSAVAADADRFLVIQLRDLTEATRMQAELVQAQKMDAMGMLVAGVSHELNNPLAAIVAFSDLIRRDTRLPEDLRVDAEMLVSEAGRTRRIVSNLLDFARQRPPERHPTALSALIGAVVELQSYALQDGRITIDVDLDPGLPAVELDRSQLQLVLVNLTQNAVQALRAGGGSGRITISGRLVAGAPSARAVPARVRIAVEDDGPGVPAEHRDRLFLPFFTTRDQGEGTGLGLPVSFGIVAAHGGRLWHEEPESGHGARFVVELPVKAPAPPSEGDPSAPNDAGRTAPAATDEPPSASTAAAEPPPAPAAAEAPPAPAAAEAPPAPTRRVLVLDDEPAIRAFLGRALQIHGIETVAAASGEEALELARTMRFDAMLCDHRMAGMAGPAVYEVLEREQPALARRFVFMTGDVLNPELRTFASSRQISLLAKPFDLATVADVVRAVLDRA